MAVVMPCEMLGWQQVHHASRSLAQQLRRSGFAPQLIIAIGRGGYVPARLLADYLDLMCLSAIRIEHYHGAQKQRQARVKYPLGHEIKGQKILLVDDVSDSGDTYQVALDYLNTLQPGEIKTAALHHKSVSRYTPDFYAEAISEWRWLIYPWAVMEDLAGFIQKQGLQGESIAIIQQQLLLDYDITVAKETLEDVLAFIF